MVDTTKEKVSSSNSHDDNIVATHQQPSTNITAATPSTNTTNKRKLDTTSSNTDSNDTSNNNPLLDDDGPPSSNKRRKKNKKKKNKGNQQNNNKSKKQQQHAKYIKKQHNWIESCSESIHRIPANCVAPLTCIVTRVEIEEEPLLPKGKVDTISAADNTISGVGGKVDRLNDDIKPSSIQVETDAKKQQQPNNIARPTQAFLSQYSKNREPWKILSTMQVDNEEKNLFIPVKRHSSTIGPTEWIKRRKQQQQSSKNSNTYVHLPNGNNGDGILNPYPTSVVPDKFWAQRKRLFSKYDEGIQIHNVNDNNDGEMWYSVTPESIANHVAEKMINNMISSQRGHQQSTNNSSVKRNSITILDVFCGCGGNSIAFARLNAEKKKEGQYPHVKVIAVDNNLSRLKMAANNAAIYNVDKDDIVFIHADAVEVLNHYNKGKLIDLDMKSSRPYESHQQAGYKLDGLDLLPTNLDGIFLSPPWGGTEYSKQEAGKSGFDIVTSIVVESSCCLGDDKPDSDVDMSTTTAVNTNGGELLSLTAKAVLNDESTKQKGVIAYFLPRNTDGIILGQSAISSDIKGSFEMEQNVVNGKVKTVTTYFGGGIDDKQED